jgi:hypothetical protein
MFARFVVSIHLVWSVPVHLHGSLGPGSKPSNAVDVAMAKLTNSGRESTAHGRFGHGGRFKGVVAAPYRGNSAGDVIGSSDVHKVGRSTGYTEGYVSNVALRIDVPFGTGTARFVDQLLVTPSKDNTGPFSEVGDSGSAVLNPDHEIVGLLFAGVPRKSVVHPIDAVFQVLASVANVQEATLRAGLVVT